MKRDMNLIRDLLIAVTATGKPRDYFEYIDDIPNKEVPHFVINRHVSMLEGEGFIVYDDCGSAELSWKGHEFLSLIRDEGIWAQLTDKLGAETLSGASISVIEAITKELWLDRVRRPNEIERSAAERRARLRAATSGPTQKFALQNPPSEARDTPTQPQSARITQGGRE